MSWVSICPGWSLFLPSSPQTLAITGKCRDLQASCQILPSALLALPIQAPIMTPFFWSQNHVLRSVPLWPLISYLLASNHPNLSSPSLVGGGGRVNIKQSSLWEASMWRWEPNSWLKANPSTAGEPRVIPDSWHQLMQQMVPFQADLGWEEQEPGQGQALQKHDNNYCCECQLLTFGVIDRAQYCS